MIDNSIGIPGLPIIAASAMAAVQPKKFNDVDMSICNDIHQKTFDQQRLSAISYLPHRRALLSDFVEEVGQ